MSIAVANPPRTRRRQNHDLEDQKKIEMMELNNSVITEQPGLNGDPRTKTRLKKTNLTQEAATVEEMAKQASREKPEPERKSRRKKAPTEQEVAHENGAFSLESETIGAGLANVRQSIEKKDDLVEKNTFNAAEEHLRGSKTRRPVKSRPIQRNARPESENEEIPEPLKTVQPHEKTRKNRKDQNDVPANTDVRQESSGTTKGRRRNRNENLIEMRPLPTELDAEHARAIDEEATVENSEITTENLKPEKKPRNRRSRKKESAAQVESDAMGAAAAAATGQDTTPANAAHQHEHENNWENTICSITVHRTDRLRPDVRIKAPWVRIQLVDVNSGKRLKRQHGAGQHAVPATLAEHKWLQQQQHQLAGGGESHLPSASLPAMNTDRFNFKQQHSSGLLASWEHKLLLNESFAYLMEASRTGQLVIMFELLDEVTPTGSHPDQKQQQQNQHSDKSNQFHVAWAFLRLIGGQGHENFNVKQRLQLFYPGTNLLMPGRLSAGGAGSSTGAGSDSAGPVLNWFFSRGGHIAQMPPRAYPSTLYVTVDTLKLAPPPPPTATASMDASSLRFNPFLLGSNNPDLEFASNRTFYELKSLTGNAFGGAGRAGGDLLLGGSRMSRRLPGQQCHIPNVLLARAGGSNSSSVIGDGAAAGQTTGSNGATCVKFSPDGVWLAVATVMTADQFPIELFRLDESFQQPATSAAGGAEQSSVNVSSLHAALQLRGHNRLVHQMNWSRKGGWLASASADGTVRVWHLSSRARAVLSHPCFVYAAVFHPHSSQLLVTAGFDQNIRVWDLSELSTGNETASNPAATTTAQAASTTAPFGQAKLLQRLQGHQGYINTLVFQVDSGNALYSGDSQGRLGIWNVFVNELKSAAVGSVSSPSKTASAFQKDWSLQEFVTSKDTENCIINNVCTHPSGHKLFVHFRDGKIRLFDLRYKTYTLVFLGMLNDTLNLRCCATPCGSFLVSGSEDGSLIAWNAQTADQTWRYKRVETDGLRNAVTGLDYHPLCHVMAVSSVAAGNATVLVYGYDAQRYDAQQSGGASKPPISRAAVDDEEREAHRHNLTSSQLAYSSARSSYVSEGAQTRAADRQRSLNQSQQRRLNRMINNVMSVSEAASRMGAGEGVGTTTGSSAFAVGDGQDDLNKSSLKITGSGRRANFTFEPAKRPPVTSSTTSQDQQQQQQQPQHHPFHQQRVVVRFEYRGERADELEFAESGATLKVLLRDGMNWLLCEDRHGRQGYIPSSYVIDSNQQEEVEEPDNRSIPSELQQQQQEQHQQQRDQRDEEEDAERLRQGYEQVIAKSKSRTERRNARNASATLQNSASEQNEETQIDGKSHQRRARFANDTNLTQTQFI